MISHWHQLKHRLIQDPQSPSHTIPHIAPHTICLFLAQTSVPPRLTPFSMCNNMHEHMIQHIHMSHFRVSSLILLSNVIMLHTDVKKGLLLKQIHAENPLPLPAMDGAKSPVRISMLAFDLPAERTTPILNTYPEVCWASLPKPIVCPSLFMAPACLLTSHSHSLHLYCSAASLTWDNENTKNVITLT